jgi:hypothetical protein
LVGSGKPDPANKKAIAGVAAIAKAHELKHQQGYEKAFKDWKPTKVAKDLMDRTFDSKSDAEDAMKAALEDLQAELLPACLELHKKEGIVTTIPQNDASIKVKTSPAGAAGCS